jgi:hypothetical protein
VQLGLGGVSRGASYEGAPSRGARHNGAPRPGAANHGEHSHDGKASVADT